MYASRFDLDGSKRLLPHPGAPGRLGSNANLTRTNATRSNPAMTPSREAPPPHDHARDTAAGWTYIFITLLGWSSVPLFLRYFTSYIDGWTANGWRYGLSALFWTPALVVAAHRNKLPAGLWKAAIVPSLANVAAQCCFAWAPYFIKPGMQTFLLRMQIVFLALGAYALFPAERQAMRTRTYWLGVAIVLGGLTGLCFLGHEPPRGQTAFGVLLGLASGIFYAGYSLSVRHYMHGVPAQYAFASICLYTTLGLMPLMLLLGQDSGAGVWSFTGLQLVMLIISAMVGIAWTHALYYAAMARLGVSIAAGVILVQPFLTSIASYFLFDEKLTPAQWTSGVIAMSGAALMVSMQKRNQCRIENSE